MEWDSDYNSANLLGYYTIYKSDYDGDFTQVRSSFNFNSVNTAVSVIKHKIAKNMKRSEGDANQEEYGLVGLNSNSFTPSQSFHNIFLEWDYEQMVPEMSVLEKIGGMIIETQGGMHLIKEDNISFSELIDTMRHFNCCSGFTDCSARRGYATLRISPKGDNRLKILKPADGFLYSVYSELISNFE